MSNLSEPIRNDALFETVVDGYTVVIDIDKDVAYVYNELGLPYAVRISQAVVALARPMLGRG